MWSVIKINSQKARGLKNKQEIPLKYKLLSWFSPLTIVFCLIKSLLGVTTKK